MMATMARIVADDPPPMRTLRPEIPAALDRVVLAGLERDRGRRWRNLDDFRRALLPFVPGQISIGEMGLRVGAFAIDWLLFTLLVWLVSFVFWWTHPEWMTAHYQRYAEGPYLDWMVLGWVGFEVLYFTVLEGIWGWSVGKRLLRLRVGGTTSTEPPGLARALVRSLQFNFLFKLAWLAQLIGMFVFMPADYYAPSASELPGFLLTMLLTVFVVPAAAFVLGIGLMVLPMRARTGYRGLHEILSGTRVIRLPWPEKAPRLRIPPAAIPLDPPAGEPERLGPYRIHGVLGRTADEVLVLGEDPGLRRKVWIWRRPVGRPALSAARRHESRAARLRWLTGGVEAERQWDAFMAPTATALTALLRQVGRLSWTEARPILEQLTDELALACAAGTLPASLTVEQVWLQPNGRVLLLDMPLPETADSEERGSKSEDGGSKSEERGSKIENGESKSTETATPSSIVDPPSSIVDPPSSDRAALALLQKTALLMLEGRVRTGEPAAAAIRAPVPGHAARLLTRLLSPGRPAEQVAAFQAELAATRNRATEVTRARRMAHLALLLALLFLPAGCIGCGGAMLSFAPIVEHMGKVELLEVAQRDLAERTPAETLALAVNPQGSVRLLAAVRLRRDLDLQQGLQRHLADERAALDARLQAANWWNRYMLQWMTIEEQKAARARGFRAALQPPGGDFRQEVEQRLVGFYWQRTRQSGSGFWPWWLSVILVVFWPAVWVVWAFLARGGLSLRILGISLVRKNGRPAYRWQCAERALAVWLPVVALLVGSIWLESWQLAATEERAWWVPWLAFGLWWGAVALVLGYVVLALWFPSRSLHDRWAGTYLVPK
jgi:hypothetical protein